MDTCTLSADRLLETGSLYRLAKVLLSAVELDLFSALASEPLYSDALATRLALHGRGAQDFFDALVALGLLKRDEDGQYQNSEASDLYLDRSKPTYLGAALAQYNDREYQMWGSLTDALRTGKPRVETIGHDHFASLYGDPDRLAAFASAMTAGSLLPARAIAERFRWGQFRTLCDVGTAQGCFPVQVALAHQHIGATGVDLPELALPFQQYVAENGVSERVRFEAVDFSRDPLPRADVIVFGRVLHNWDLTTKKMLLTKACQAVPLGGAVVVYDMLIDDGRSATISGLLSSLNMLVWTSAGFGYTGADCMAWMREVGLKNTQCEPLVSGNSMVVGHK
jgi:hypothetical protein